MLPNYSVLLQGCAPQLVSYFHYIHSVVAGVSIIAGAVPIIFLGAAAVAMLFLSCTIFGGAVSVNEDYT